MNADWFETTGKQRMKEFCDTISLIFEENKKHKVKITESHITAIMHYVRGEGILTDHVIKEIRRLRELGVSTARIVERYGLVQSTVDNIISKRRWKDVV